MVFGRRPIGIVGEILALAVVAFAIFGLAVPSHLVLGETGPSPRSAVRGPSVPSAPGRVRDLAPRHAGSEATQANPANCSQGQQGIRVSPSTPALQTALLTDYDTLGAEGGGTIELEAGTFVLHATLVFRGYGNVSIQGAGVGKTILSLPSDPVGKFISTTGQKLGLWNYTLGHVVDGSVADFIRVDGPTPINNFEMCSLTLRAEANNASEDWDGSLLFDSSGGYHHVYEDLAMSGFYGPSTIPNGIHLEDFSNSSRGYDYVVDNVTADNNTLPFEYSPWVVGGPNFLNIGPIVNCTIENLTGIGLFAFELAPPQGCVVENVNVTGHVLIDPVVGGSWGNTLFQNLTVDSRNTAAPNAMGASVANGTSHGASTFTHMRWNRDTFYGNVLHGQNLVDIENSTFYGGLNGTPSIFTGNQVVMTDWSPNRVDLPIEIDGCPGGGMASNFSSNTFVFPNSTFKLDPFVLNVPLNSWWNDTIEIAGRSTGFLFRAPDITLAKASVFSNISYLSLGNGSPVSLTLLDLENSPGFVDLGATVGLLSQILNNLPQYAPTPPTDVRSLGLNTTTVHLAWNASQGNVTNYTVYAGTNASNLSLAFSAGLGTEYFVGGLQPGTQYDFEVVAWNSSFPSAPSDPFEAATETLPQYAPGAPSGLGVTGAGTTSVALNWSAPKGNVTNYTILVGLADSDWSQRISAGLVLDYNVSGLASNTTYFFAIVAWNASWSSPPSAAVSATTLPAATPPPTGTTPPSPPPAPSPGSPPPETTSPAVGSVLTSFDQLILVFVVAGLLAVVLGALAGVAVRQARARRLRGKHHSRSAR